MQMSEIKKLRGIILISLFTSNLATYLLASPDAHVDLKPSELQVHRQDYIQVKLKARLATPFQTELPVILANRTRSVIIKHAFLLSRETKEQYQLNEQVQGHYDLTGLTVFIHRDDFKKVEHSEYMTVYPHSIKLSRPKKPRRNHELTY